ncbi:hypothetical protein BpHYR1_019948 [Brachionus plicatilis]|uniref:Uncharacterized protein n=1 Tax=Brachionus plicatilis TaxID=10195 RepID=A0A3M7S624_BRAPC|nr:hypothetical protein BpHYR1_019948 [Brachionus plicatilis]
MSSFDKQLFYYSTTSESDAFQNRRIEFEFHCICEFITQLPFETIEAFNWFIAARIQIYNASKDSVDYKTNCDVKPVGLLELLQISNTMNHDFTSIPSLSSFGALIAYEFLASLYNSRY